MTEERFDMIKKHLITYQEGADQTVYCDAHGTHFITEDGKDFINLNEISCVLGFQHPEFTRRVAHAVTNQLLCHAGTCSGAKEDMIRNFMEVTHGDFDKIFIAGSGGEVVDWSIKLARRYTGKDGIISFHNAIHGRSFAGAYLSGTPARKAGFGSGLEHVSFWDFPADGRSFEPTADAYQDIAAIIIEPYQAIGGMASPSPEYWTWLREYTRKNNILIIMDEIQTGFGKTGSFFAYEESGIVPDILLAGKGMSNGFGLGAMLMTREVGASVKPHELSGGSADNNLMCSIVNTVFDLIREENLLAHVTEVGRLLSEELEQIFASKQITCRYRGKGLFFSLELPEGLAAEIATKAKEQGILFGRGANRLVIRTPLVLTREDVGEVCRVVRNCVSG